MGTVLIASTASLDPSKNFEVGELYRAAELQGHEVRLVDPRDLTYRFEPGSPPIPTDSFGETISADLLITRSSRHAPAGMFLLHHCLEANGTACLDPIERYLSSASGKTTTTASRHQREVGAKSEVAFTIEAALATGRRWADSTRFIIKPALGRGGVGIHVATSADYDQALQEHFAANGGPILFQELLDIEAEYRVLAIDRIAIGAARKTPAPGSSLGNAKQGATFTNDVPESVVRWAVSAGTGKGLVGMDVASTEHGLLLLEENRSPGWQALQDATGLDVATEILLTAWASRR